MGSELGKGSFATVFGALHRKTGTWYAVKIIQLSKVSKNQSDQVDASGRPRNPFQREISVMESLRHRNICRMKEVFIEPDTLGTSHDVLVKLERRRELFSRYRS
jgi:ser/thr/tyr protein kinase RAD53